MLISALLFAKGEDEFNLIVNLTGALSILLTVSISAFFLFMDIYLKPGKLRKYKVQPNTNEPVNLRKTGKVFDILWPRKMSRPSYEVYVLAELRIFTFIAWLFWRKRLLSTLYLAATQFIERK